MKELLSTVLIAPSSRGFRPWQFVVVDDKNLLERLAEAKDKGSAFLKDAPLVMVILADPDVSDVWVEDCSIAAYTVQTCARELGLGTCWVQIRSRKDPEGRPSQETVREILQIPENLCVECVIALGYPGEEKKAYTEEDMDWSKVHKNGY